jgi:hypothetical protein
LKLAEGRFEETGGGSLSSIGHVGCLVLLFGALLVAQIIFDDLIGKLDVLRGLQQV